MCENMTISEVCVVSEVLCSVSDGHYTESAIVQFLMKKKGDASTQYACLI
jgi:hypothetical protein